MNKPARALSLIVLVATLLVAGIAAMPAQLAPPSQPTVIATANAGEFQVSWNRVAGAQHYTVGYASPDEMDRMAAAGRNRLDAFNYVTIGAANTSHTFTGLEPETVYWVTVGAHTQRFRATDLVWATRHAVATTAGEHGDGFCPITGLPLPDDGYLSVGNNTTHSNGNVFTLDSVTQQATRRDLLGTDISPTTGRLFIKVCGTISVGALIEYVSAADYYNVATDAGIGFTASDTSVTDWADVGILRTGVTANACEIWDIPASANTVIVAVNNGQNSPGLYRVDLTDTGATPTPTATTTTTTTPLTNQELTKRVKPALGQIVVTNSDGSTSSGTGFVVRSSGLMVTNRHVVDNASAVTVYMQDLNGQLFEYTGTVLGRGILADLAVIQLPSGRTYSVLPLANSDEVIGADEVTAWGYPAGSISGIYPTITRGIISSKGIYGDVDFLQTDAAINPGNSGGPLIDQYGNVVGVNTMKRVDASIDNQGFAIASNEVRFRLNTLAAGGLNSERYRNTKYGYGYSVNIPKGWYLNDESGIRTTFFPYHNKGFSRVKRWDLSDAFVGSNDKLTALAEWRWSDLADKAQENEWTVFEPVAIRSVGSGDERRYRLEYRRQSESQYCITHHVEVIALSSSRPANLGFSLMGSVCEDSIAQYFTERAAILNNFRP